MKKIYLLLTLMLSSVVLSLNAQSDELSVGLRAGDNSTFGGFAAVSVETFQNIVKDFNIRGGVQYNTIGKTTLDARPSYIMDFQWGNLSADMVVTYMNLASVNSFAAGAGAGINIGRVGLKLGYYYRLYGGNGNKITEPFNIYYELCLHLLQKIEKWDMYLSITNKELFELERHFQPSFIAECIHFPNSRIGIAFGIGCKPAGMFNMSADYYQSYLKTGLCCRW